MIDTGGIEPDSGDIILSQMREQAQIAIDTADVIIFITDVQQGLVDSDAKVADMLRRSQKPVVLVVNKVDSFQKYMMDVYEFYNLGIGEPMAISAANRTGLGDMLDEVVKTFSGRTETEEEDDMSKDRCCRKAERRQVFYDQQAAWRRPGNRIRYCRYYQRCQLIQRLPWNGKEYIFIDTAGLRRKSKIKEEIGTLQCHPYSDSCGAGRCGSYCDRCYRGCYRAGCQDCRNRP